MSKKQVINPQALGQTSFYHHVCVSEGRKMVHVAGQVAYDNNRNIVGPGDLEVQTRHAFGNLKLAVEAGGAQLEDLVMMTIYVVNLGDGDRDLIADVWSEFLPVDQRPSCTLVGVSRLAFEDMLVEIEGTAVID